MKHHRTVIRIAAAAASVAVAAPLSIQSAHADSVVALEGGGYLRASGSFQAEGEIFRVVDRRSDAYPIAGIVYFGPTQDGFCETSASTGVGKVKTCNLSFPEGKPIYYRLYVKKTASSKVTYMTGNVYDVT